MGTDEDTTIKDILQKGKEGRWDFVKECFDTSDGLFLRKLARKRDEHSGWSLLQWAARDGAADICYKLIGHGAQASLKDTPKDGHPDALARDAGYEELAKSLSEALSSMIDAPDDPSLIAASRLWENHTERTATELFKVSYGLRKIKIRTGIPYYTDCFGRVLVGWHGSFSPPRGMDGNSMIH